MTKAMVSVKLPEGMAAAMQDVSHNNASGSQASNNAASSVIWMPPKISNEPFPDVSPKVLPAGFRILVQLRRSGGTVEGSSLLASEETMDIQNYKCNVGKVIALGPVAYKDRKTGEPWSGGAWCKVGDIVRVPPHGGDRWAIYPNNDQRNKVIFTIINDDSVIGVTSDHEGCHDNP